MDKVVMSLGGDSRLFSPLLSYMADGLSELFLPAMPSGHYLVKQQEKQG